jgi:UDP-glucose 6-dehydrogenase
VCRDGTFATLVWDEEEQVAVEKAERRANLRFTRAVGEEGRRAVREADLVVFCVGTPMKDQAEGSEGRGGAMDVTALERAVGEVAENMKNGVIVVVKSTVPIGMAGRVRERVSLPMQTH